EGPTSVWTVDMSATVDEFSDEDSAEDQYQPTLSVRSTARKDSNDAIYKPEPSGQNAELPHVRRHEAMAELNPWSIAAMGSLKRRPPARLNINQLNDQQPTPSSTSPGVGAMEMPGQGLPSRRPLPTARPNSRFKLPISRLTPSPSNERNQLDSPLTGRNHFTVSPLVHGQPQLSHRILPSGPKALGRREVQSNSADTTRRQNVPTGEVSLPAHTVDAALSEDIENARQRRRQQDDRPFRKIANANIMSGLGGPEEEDTDSSDPTTELSSSQYTDSDSETELPLFKTHIRAQQHSNGSNINNQITKQYPIQKKVNGSLTHTALPLSRNNNTAENRNGAPIGPMTQLASLAQQRLRMAIAKTTPTIGSGTRAQVKWKQDGLDYRLSNPRSISWSERNTTHCHDDDRREEETLWIRSAHFAAPNHDTDRGPQRRRAIDPSQNTRSRLPLKTSGNDTRALRITISTLEPTPFQPVGKQKGAGLGGESHPPTVSQSLRRPFSEWDTATLAQLKKLLRKLAPATEWTLHPKDPEERKEMKEIGTRWVKDMGFDL
ncbi:hypothetical protein B0T21DRAFT_287971, partial [Apiosordaria backusii]